MPPLAVAAPAATPSLSVAAPAATPSLSVPAAAPTKASFYQQIASAPSTTPNSAFYNNPYGVSAQEIDAMTRANPYAAPAATPAATPTTVTPASTGQTYEQFLQQQAEAGFPTAQANVGAAANTYATNQGQVELPSDIQSITNTGLGQNAVNAENYGDYLAKIQGTAGVNDMINHGLESGGIQLDNSNAADSSAADAMARAYGLLGRDQMSTVGDQFAQAQAKTDAAQQTQTGYLNSAIDKYQGDEAGIISSIVNTARNSIDQINLNMAGLSLPQRMDADSQIAQIKQNAAANLATYDQQSQAAQTGAPLALTPQQAAARAAQLATAGTAAASPFTYSTVAPPTVAGTGPSPSPLPIYAPPSVTKQQS